MVAFWKDVSIKVRYTRFFCGYFENDIDVATRHLITPMLRG
jgi:hypothetical protein